MICGGVSPIEWQSQITLKEQFPNKVFMSFGLHPWYIANTSDTQLDKDLEHLFKLALKADLLGETGLDGYGKWNDSMPKQIKYFEHHLELSKALSKPLVIHNVKATAKTLKMLQVANLNSGGMIHSFNGNLKDAEGFMALGFYLSLGPSILKNNKLALHNISLDYLLLESDAPEQAPSSRILLDIASHVAKAHKVECDRVIEANYNNFHKLLGVSHGMDADSHKSSTT
jgi:TatD DNase family protein